MKKKFATNLASLMLLSTVSFSTAFAADICTDPLSKVCTETKATRIERENNVNALKQEISAEANKNAAPRIEEMKKKTPKWRFIRRAIQTYKIRNQEIMKSAKLRVGDLEKVVTSPENVAKLKSYMYQAIDETNIDATNKQKFKEIISTVVIGNFADYLEKSGLEDNFILQLLANACGSDGLVDNAFATTLDNQRYVLVCPGFLVTLSKQASEQEKFNSILQAIAHEMGHHIDNSKVGNEIYAPYMSCLAKNHIDRFNKSKDDEKFCKKNEKDVAACANQVVLSHAGELIADQWGIKVTAIHAKKEGYSFGDSEKMLVDSWAKLCGSGDEGIHPIGDFRIGTLMRTNPSIVNTLSCGAASEAKPACTFDGEVANQ